jgi:hypothetical protein
LTGHLIVELKLSKSISTLDALLALRFDQLLIGLDIFIWLSSTDIQTTPNFSGFLRARDFFPVGVENWCVWRRMNV